MIGQLGRLIAAGVFGLIMIVGFLVSRADVFAAAGPAPGDLTRKDVYGSARLTASQRDDGVKTCRNRIGLFSGMLASRASSRRAAVDEPVRRFCDCFVNQVEDRSSMMQYTMAMNVLSVSSVLSNYRSFPAFPKYKTAAARHGMSTDEFETMRRELGRSLTQAAEQCVSNMVQ